MRLAPSMSKDCGCLALGATFLAVSTHATWAKEETCIFFALACAVRLFDLVVSAWSLRSSLLLFRRLQPQREVSSGAAAGSASSLRLTAWSKS